MISASKIAGALGAEISGVDLSKPLSREEFGELKRLWLEHLVIFFRNQDLNEKQYMAFAGQFGEPIEYPLVKGIAGFPKIIEVKKLEHERVALNGGARGLIIELARDDLLRVLSPTVGELTEV